MNISILKKLFFERFGEECLETALLVPAGSPRQYYRLSNGNITAVGAYNRDVRENRAFFHFTKHFISKSLPVPELYAMSEDEMYYLLEDLGDTTLKEMTDTMKKGWDFPREMIPWYHKAIDNLILFQTEGHKGLDYSPSMPRNKFDERSMLWDLNHFKYFFLKLSGIPYDEDKLENDFQNLSQRLGSVEKDSFLFRDFQSRNIMVKNNKLYFIDYQGGREGALQYDIASLLFEARTNMGQPLREELLKYYIEAVARVKKQHFKTEKFLADYYLFALIRQLQAMGAYGLRGWVEKKPLFLQSVPFAMQNLKYFLEKETVTLEHYPELKRLMGVMVTAEKLNKAMPVAGECLCVRINSFSYHKSIPDDLTGEGGGFVFDCRGIHNPGRYPEVQKFFVEKTDMKHFLKDVFSIVDRSVETYIERGFKNLQLSFGCTGGQHRSVFAAQKMAEHLEHNPSLSVLLEHREINFSQPPT